MKSYSELVKIDNYLDRYLYLKTNSSVGDETFGGNRWLNQIFYKSPEWRHFRDSIIMRDNGCDMAFPGRSINDRILIHHINPITAEDIEKRSYILMDPENVVCVSRDTHNAIHYGDENLLHLDIRERKPGDTKLW